MTRMDWHIYALVLDSPMSKVCCKFTWCFWAPDFVFKGMPGWKMKSKGKNRKEGGGKKKNQSWAQSRKANSYWLNIQSNNRCAFSLQMPNHVQNPFVSISSYTQLTTQSWRKEAAGSCSHTGKSILPNDLRSTSRKRMEQGISRKGAAGRASLHHPLSAAFLVFCDYTVSCLWCPARQKTCCCLQLPPWRVYRQSWCSSEMLSNRQEATDTACLTS